MGNIWTVRGKHTPTLSLLTRRMKLSRCEQAHTLLMSTNELPMTFAQSDEEGVRLWSWRKSSTILSWYWVVSSWISSHRLSAMTWYSRTSTTLIVKLFANEPRAELLLRCQIMQRINGTFLLSTVALTSTACPSDPPWWHNRSGKRESQASPLCSLKRLLKFSCNLSCDPYWIF